MGDVGGLGGTVDQGGQGGMGHDGANGKGEGTTEPSDWDDEAPPPEVPKLRQSISGIADLHMQELEEHHGSVTVEQFVLLMLVKLQKITDDDIQVRRAGRKGTDF